MPVKIGLTSGYNDGIFVEKWPLVYINKGLVEKVEKFNAVPVIIPVVQDMKLIEDYLDLVDGIIISGEVVSIKHNTVRNGGENSLYSSNPLRYLNEKELILGALKRKIPILGICRGHQMINVVQGGTLKQEDITLDSNVLHQQANVADPNNVVHSISILKNSKLNKMTEQCRTEVNSFHRQAIENLPDSYIASAVADDGNIEAFENIRDSFVMGVQFHPEMLDNEIWNHFFENFIKIVEVNRQNRKKI